MGMAAGLLAIGLGLLWHTQAIFLVIGVVLVALTVIALARHQLAFRADHTGILLPGQSDRLTARRGPAVLIPWANVEQIILYSREPAEQAPVQRIGIQCHTGGLEARKITSDACLVLRDAGHEHLGTQMLSIAPATHTAAGIMPAGRGCPTYWWGSPG